MGAPAASRRGRAHRSELVTSTFERLRDLIVTGRLAPGAPIIETETAASLGVPRSYLRIALQRLQQLGFVETTARGTYSRTRVAPLTLEDALELFILVGALEGVAAHAAAALPQVERTELADELTRINAELLASSRERPPSYIRAYDLDIAFHHRYVDRAGGPRLRALYHGVKPQADRYERFYTNALMDQIAVSVSEHEAIVRAIASGDADAAQHAAEVNWRNAADRLRRIITEAGERGQL
jgi:DNA-binding GntR family transcriptional regulator